MRSPTAACAESARLRSTATVPGRSAARLPSRTPRSWTVVTSPATPWADADCSRRSPPLPAITRTDVRVIATPARASEGGSVIT